MEVRLGQQDQCNNHCETCLVPSIQEQIQSHLNPFHNTPNCLGNHRCHRSHLDIVRAENSGRSLGNLGTVSLVDLSQQASEQGDH
jgi:hypothetical protein